MKTDTLVTSHTSLLNTWLMLCIAMFGNRKLMRQYIPTQELSLVLGWRTELQVKGMAAFNMQNVSER